VDGSGKWPPGCLNFVNNGNGIEHISNMLEPYLHQKKKDFCIPITQNTI
jgi:hypothetical protein